MLKARIHKMQNVESNQAPEICLIDGSGYIFRAYYGLPPMTRKDGTPVNAVYGFCSMLGEWLNDKKLQYIGVIFDTSRISFRNEIYPDYKANRSDTPEDLIPQFALIREAVEAFGFVYVEKQGFEADDLIATYAAIALQEGIKVKIISSDKDLMQLVDHNTDMFDPMKKKHIGVDQVVEKFGVNPDRVCDVQALAGDSSDNVPGVPGIGIKTAASLINEYGDLESLLANVVNIKQPKRRQSLEDNAELARISYQLVTLARDVDVPFAIEKFKRQKPDFVKLASFFEQQNFTSMIKRFAHHEHKDTMHTDSMRVAQPAQQNIKSDYTLVQTTDVLDHWIKASYQQGIVSIKTQTLALAGERKLIGISLALKAGKACYVPIGHSFNEHGDLIDDNMQTHHEQLQINDVIACLKPILEDASVIKVGQNIKYDINIFAAHHIQMTSIEDIMLMSFVLYGGLHKHDIDTLSQLYLDHAMIDFSDVVGSGRKKVTFDKVSLELAYQYASEEVDIALRLYYVLRQELYTQSLNSIYQRLERPLICVLASMEQGGVCIDPMKLQQLGNDFNQRASILEQEVHDIAGEVFNLASPKQLGEILFCKLGIDGGKRSKTGAFGTASDVLEPLSKQYPIIEKLLEWRSITKLRTTYCQALLREMKGAQNRIHTSYTMTGAQTGRLSSIDPNLQNIPIRTDTGKLIREAFIAPQDKMLVSLDYSQIELRLLGEIAAIDKLQQAFIDGLDIHAMTASQIFNISIDQVSSDLRRQAKAVNFGVIYGISPFGLAKQLGCSQREAKQFIDQYLERFEGVQHFMTNSIQEAHEQGYVVTLFGRRIHLPGIKDKNPIKRHYAERQAINAPIQGSAADLIKRAMIAMPSALIQEGFDGDEMRLQVHDELVFEVDTDKAELLMEIAKKVMVTAAEPAKTLKVPIEVDSTVAKNWLDAH